MFSPIHVPLVELHRLRKSGLSYEKMAEYLRVPVHTVRHALARKRDIDYLPQHVRNANGTPNGKPRELQWIDDFKRACVSREPISEQPRAPSELGQVGRKLIEVGVDLVEAEAYERGYAQGLKDAAAADDDDDDD